MDVRFFLVFVLFLLIPTKAISDEYCDAWSTYAEVVMGNRQNNLDLSQMLSIASKNKDTEAIATNLVIRAYDSPLFRVDKNKKEAIMNFKNKTMLRCVKGQLG